MRLVVGVLVALYALGCSSSSVNDANGSGGKSGSGSGGTSGAGGSGASGGSSGDASTGGTAGVAGSSSDGGDAGVGEDCVSQLVAGAYQTCALLSDKSVWCWGDNSQPVPTQVLTDAVEIAAGGFHTCARKTGGSVACWGTNAQGQLGAGGADAGAAPVEPVLPNVAIQISAAGASTCARIQGGDIYCWGDNGSAQAGTGAVSGPLTAPTEAVALVAANVTEIIAGGSAACSRNSDSMLWCWGSNTDGALGIGSTDPGPELTPKKVGFSANVTSIVRSTARCAIANDFTLWCWGANPSGQVGNNTTTNAISPVQVTKLGAGVATISNTFAKTCASKSDGSAWCWGRNDKGSIGDGTKDGAPCGTNQYCKLEPVQVVGLSDVKSVAAGIQHACAALKDGTVWCWGAKPQLGDGSGSAQTCGTGPECQPAPVKTLIQCP